MKYRSILSVVLLGILAAAQLAGQSDPTIAHPPADAATSDSNEPGENVRPANLNIFFTGYLLGYYRLPQWQTQDFEPACPDATDDNALWKQTSDGQLDQESGTPALQLLQELQSKSYADVLVGMGDNFGVTLESRVYRSRDSDEKPWQLHPKSRDLSQWPAAPSANEIGDNVGCFFSRAGYDAIVPGKDDFYFGPERLRRIAGRLENVPKANGLHPVRMLGANLVIKTDYLPGKKPADILDSDKTLLFSPGMPSGVKSIDVSDNGSLLPFARQIRFEIASTSSVFINPPAVSSKPAFRPFLCQVPAGKGFDKLDPIHCAKFYDFPAPQQEQSKDDQGDKEGKTTWDFDLPENWASQVPGWYGLCVAAPPADGTTRGAKNYCIRFTVAEPLFGKSDSEPYMFKKITRKDDSLAYAVIFGIVDKDLTSLVGRDNLSWRNDLKEVEPGDAFAASRVPEGKETYGTSVDTLDPATTLGFAIRHFDLDWQDANWRKRHGVPPNETAKPIRILLAQMERGKAETLAANLARISFSSTRLNFDVVISSATDFSAATANERVTFDLPIAVPTLQERSNHQPTRARPEFRQFVVVPWKGYDGPPRNRLPDPLRILTLTESNCDTTACRERTFNVEGNFSRTFPAGETMLPGDLKDKYAGIGRGYLSGKGYLPLPQAKPVTNTFELATLDILRAHSGADVAMLQKRDFYWGPFTPTLNPTAGTQPSGEQLDRILWMGDFVQVLTVKGDTLKKILDESDKFDALDAETDTPAVETGRGVLTLGIEKTHDKQYLVDGTLLDPNRLYTLATSNHIAAGDNGYQELADPQLSHVTLPLSVGSPRLSFLVCLQLGGESCGSNPDLKFATIQEPLASPHLPSVLEPPDSARVRAWTRQLLYGPPLLGDGNSLVDYRAQLNPTWRLSLKDFSFNLSGVRNNLSEIQRSTELAGVSEQSAGNPKGHTVDYASHAEFVRSAKTVDLFLRGLAVYKATVTANTQTLTQLAGETAPPTVSALPTVSRSKNQSAIDAGFFIHDHDKHDNRYGLVLEPFHFDTLLHPNEIPVNAYYSRTTDVLINPAIELNLARDRRFLSRLAFRSESSKSSVEVGIQGGWEQNDLLELRDNLGVNCLQSALSTLSSCLKSLQQTVGFNNSSLRPLYGTRQNNGLYVNLDWTVPMIWRLSFRTEDYGEYDRPAHLDNSTNTLYRNDAKETLKFAVLPNLTLGPALERFDYEDKVEHIHLRTWSPVFNVTYSFDKYSGGDWKKSLGYSPNASSAK